MPVHTHSSPDATFVIEMKEIIIALKRDLNLPRVFRVAN